MGLAARAAGRRRLLLRPELLEPLHDLLVELLREDALRDHLVRDLERRLAELLAGGGVERDDLDLRLPELVEEVLLEALDRLAVRAVLGPDVAPRRRLQLVGEREDRLQVILAQRLPPLEVEDDGGRLVDVVRVG